MLEVGAKLRKNKLEILTLTILLVGAIVLRFVNLGYSNYTADEYGAMVWSKHTQNNFPTDLKEFFLTRKKGPTQYLVSHIPISITGDYNNELALRTPFAVFSALSIIVFYFLVKRLTKSKLTASISSFVLLTSGFICGFGRIAQYQNLNMFFSFAAHIQPH